MHKAKDLRAQSREELQRLAKDVEKDLFHLRGELRGAKKLEKPHRLRELKKDRARILTLITEKERDEQSK